MKQPRYLLTRRPDGTILFWDSKRGYGGGSGDWTPNQREATKYQSERGITIAYSALRRKHVGSLLVGMKTDDGVVIVETVRYSPKYEPEI